MRREPLAATRVASSFVLLACLACAPSFPPPPRTGLEPVVDALHGVEITDDYRWLEAQDDPRVRDWIAAQNQYTSDVMAPAQPIVERFRARLAELIDVPEAGNPREAGEWLVFTQRRPGEATAKIVRIPAPPEDAAPEPLDPEVESEVLVDPMTLRPDGTASVGIVAISPDHRVLLYSVRDGGADEVEIRARDLESGADLPDVLPWALYGGFTFATDSSGFLYVHRSRDEGPRLRHHVLGTDVSEDREIFGEGIDARRFLGVRRGGGDRWLLLSVRHGWRSADLYLLPVEEDGVTPSGPVRELVVGEDAQFYPRFRDDDLLVLTDLDAPLGRVVEIDLEHTGPESWHQLIPEQELPMTSIDVVGERLVATLLRDASTELRFFDLAGERLDEPAVEVPPFHAASLGGLGEDSTRLTLGSFLLPQTSYRLDLESGEREPWEVPEIPFDASAFETRQLFATSADGTPVPLFIVQRKGIVLDGSHPTLLTGYGGFDVALRPRFRPGTAAWLEAGGVFAQATLRGGGEYGEAWHRAGMLERKPNVFADFLAAAEQLIEAGYTTSDRLAIRGTSNGGLLVGAAFTMRPVLFRAVYCGFPDLDMIRFPSYVESNNQPALLEYGDSRIEDQFRAHLGFSPYQAVRDGARYPAILLRTGALDTRVPPAQARKMAARLQAASGSGLPVLLRHDPRAGHAGGRRIDRRIEDAAEELAFLWWQLGAR